MAHCTLFIDKADKLQNRRKIDACLPVKFKELLITWRKAH